MGRNLRKKVVSEAGFEYPHSSASSPHWALSRAPKGIFNAGLAVIYVFRKCPSDRKPLSFLKHEFYVLSKLSHPGIPRPLGWEGDCLLVEEAEGAPLDDIDEGIVAALAEILDYIHGEGVIHRDVNPSNIACGQRVMLLDFDVSIY